MNPQQNQLLNARRGLIIRSPWIEEILAGRKTWEIRGSNTRIRGPIALTRGGSGLIVGTCELEAVLGPLSIEQLRENTERHRIPRKDLATPPYPTTFAWVLGNPRPLETPIPYRHPPGAIIWVKLAERLVSLDEQASPSQLPLDATSL